MNPSKIILRIQNLEIGGQKLGNGDSRLESGHRNLERAAHEARKLNPGALIRRALSRKPVPEKRFPGKPGWGQGPIY